MEAMVLLLCILGCAMIPVADLAPRRATSKQNDKSITYKTDLINGVHYITVTNHTVKRCFTYYYLLTTKCLRALLNQLPDDGSLDRINVYELAKMEYYAKGCIGRTKPPKKPPKAAPDASHPQTITISRTPGKPLQITQQLAKSNVQEYEMQVLPDILKDMKKQAKQIAVNLLKSTKSNKEPKRNQKDVSTDSDEIGQDDDKDDNKQQSKQQQQQVSKATRKKKTDSQKTINDVSEVPILLLHPSILNMLQQKSQRSEVPSGHGARMTSIGNDINLGNQHSNTFPQTAWYSNLHDTTGFKGIPNEKAPIPLDPSYSPRQLGYNLPPNQFIGQELFHHPLSRSSYPFNSQQPMTNFDQLASNLGQMTTNRGHLPTDQFLGANPVNGPLTTRLGHLFQQNDPSIPHSSAATRQSDDGIIDHRPFGRMESYDSSLNEPPITGQQFGLHSLPNPSQQNAPDIPHRLRYKKHPSSDDSEDSDPLRSSLSSRISDNPHSLGYETVPYHDTLQGVSHEDIVTNLPNQRARQWHRGQLKSTPSSPNLALTKNLDYDSDDQSDDQKNVMANKVYNRGVSKFNRNRGHNEPTDDTDIQYHVGKPTRLDTRIASARNRHHQDVGTDDDNN